MSARTQHFGVCLCTAIRAGPSGARLLERNLPLARAFILRIMAPTWKTIAVRIARPPEVSPADFLAAIRSWLDHHCILLADFKSKTNAFDAVFDNPRDARLFERRFAVQPPSGVPGRVASRLPVKATSFSVAAPTVSDLVSVGDAA
jgi:hypothetical protein